jgi:hypothetical protein
MKALYIFILLACSLVAVVSGEFFSSVERNYQDALYAVLVESDGTDLMNAEIMALYGFDVSGTEIEDPAFIDKLIAFRNKPRR